MSFSPTNIKQISGNPGADELNLQFYTNARISGARTGLPTSRTHIKSIR
jgi:hypothetical protein